MHTHTTIYIHTLPFTACSKGMYKLTKGDVEKCQPCPNNSDSKTTGQAFCPCKEGFSRVKGEHNSSPCTGQYNDGLYIL